MEEKILENKTEENKMNENETVVTNETETTNETEPNEFPVVRIIVTAVGAITTIVGGVISLKQKKLESADYRYRCDTMVRAVEAGADSETIYRLFRNRSFFERVFGDRKR